MQRLRDLNGGFLCLCAGGRGRHSSPVASVLEEFYVHVKDNRKRGNAESHLRFVAGSMALSTFAVGFLPNSDATGIAAPIIPAKAASCAAFEAMQ